jgi:hypothetical protein
MQLRRRFVFPLIVLCGACVYGCRKAKIDAPTVSLEPAVSVGALPESKPSGKQPAWYQGLMPTAAPEAKVEDRQKSKDKKESDKDRPWAPIDTPTELPKPDKPSEKKPEKEPETPPTTAAAARADAQVLVDELRERIESERKGKATWNLLRLELYGAGSDKGKTLTLMADVGLSSLYAARPEILFEQLPFEDCMNRLARMAGLRYAQLERIGNPLVTWRGENVSTYDAVQAIAAQHGFSARFVAAGTRFTFPLAKYATREKFVEEVTSAVRENGKQMEQGFPTLLISPASKASKAKPEDTKGKKETKEQPKEEPKNVKQ